MSKNRKASANHFLNTRLKAKETDKDGQIKPRYPIYVKIRSHYQQSQIKSFYWIFQFETLEDLSSWFDIYNNIYGEESKYGLNDSNLYLTKEEYEAEIEQNETFRFLLNREAEFIQYVAQKVHSIYSEQFDIRIVTNNLLKLMVPVQFLISNYYKKDLRMALVEDKLHDLVDVVNWNKPFWDIYKGLKQSQNSLYDSSSPVNTFLNRILISFQGTYNVLEQFNSVTENRLIWAFEFDKYLIDEDFIKQLSLYKDLVYSQSDVRKLISRISAEISALFGEVLSEKIIEDD